MSLPGGPRQEQPACIQGREESYTLKEWLEENLRDAWVGLLTGLGGLCCFIDQHSPELQLAQPRVTTPNTSRADHVSCRKNLLFALPNERLVLPFVIRTQFPLLILQLDKFLKLNVCSVVGHLTMQGQESDGRVQSFTRLGCQTHNFQTSRVDFLGELIDGNI